MERVMTLLAQYFVSRGISVRLIVLTKQPHFYPLDDRIQVVEPDFTIDQMPRICFTFRNFLFLRRQLRESARVVLSFGGKYNAFVLLASYGLGKSVFISDRSRPGIGYGVLLNRINPLLYRWAAGIIAQTERAKSVIFYQTRHPRIAVIPNPVRPIEGTPFPSSDKIILTVGRLIPTKKFDWLLDIFAGTRRDGWKLIILGDGPLMDALRRQAAMLGIADSVTFAGNRKDIDDYYRSAHIFAFTSVSEGFPNALAEAMATPLPCIAFDCEAGPSDLIDDGVNGFLLTEGALDTYRDRLQQLMDDETLRFRFSEAAFRRTKELTLDQIGRQFEAFMMN